MKRLAPLVLAFVLSGCVNCVIRTCGAPASWGRPYIGTRAWFELYSNAPSMWVVWWLDFPFEVVTDTLCLPVDFVLMPFWWED